MFSFRAAEKNVALSYSITEQVGQMVLGDEARVRQVLVNLVGNAIKFTHQGRVRISVDRTTGELLRFRVDDTGTGIAPHEQGLIFEAFRQVDGSTSRKYGGTGLGLSISSRLVELMGGKIWVTSQLGSGSCFGFELPAPVAGERVVAPMQSPVKPPWTNTVGVASLRVLVAEDNAVNRKLATRLLEKRGHRVWSAGNGIEALESLRRDEFDAVLMDIQMPEMDGVEAVAQWRVEEAGRGRGRLPIIALTANAMAGDEERYRAVGMDGFVAKPFEPDRLFAVLEELAGNCNAA
jgi:CheY-like chemotaxis protein